MSWFNLDKDLSKKRKQVEDEFKKTLENYYQSIKLTPEQSKHVKPDVDEVKEQKQYLKEHPEEQQSGNTVIGDNKIDSGLYIDPLNPITKITKRVSNRKKSKKEVEEETHRIIRQLGERAVRTNKLIRTIEKPNEQKKEIEKE